MCRINLVYARRMRRMVPQVLRIPVSLFSWIPCGSLNEIISIPFAIPFCFIPGIRYHGTINSKRTARTLVRANVVS